MPSRWGTNAPRDPAMAREAPAPYVAPDARSAPGDADVAPIARIGAVPMDIKAWLMQRDAMRDATVRELEETEAKAAELRILLAEIEATYGAR